MPYKNKSLLDGLDHVFNKYRGKRVTVLHSGGLDSNILVASLYLAGADVNAVSIRAANLASAEIEERTRMLFIERLKSEASGQKVGSIVRNVLTFNGDLPGIQRNRFSQMYIWLNMLPLVSREDDDAIILGYVMSDQGNTMIEHLKKTWRTHRPYLKWSAQLPDLVFPIERFAKAELVKYFQTKCQQFKLDENLVHIHWFCEMNRGGPLKRCGRCESCRRAANEKIDDWDVASNVTRIFKNRADLMNFLELPRDSYDVRFKVEEDGAFAAYAICRSTEKRFFLYQVSKFRADTYSDTELINIPNDKPTYEHYMYPSTNNFPNSTAFPELFLDLDVEEEKKTESKGETMTLK